MKLIFLYLFCSILFACAQKTKKWETVVQSQLFDAEKSSFSLEREYWLGDLSSYEKKLEPALVALKAQQWQKSLTLSQEFLKKNPDHIQALLLVALSYRGLKQLNLAQYFVQRALSFNAHHASSLNIKGILLLEQQKKGPAFEEEALKLFKDSFKFSSKEIAAGLNAGFLLLEKKNASEAHSIFSLVQTRCGYCIFSKIGLGLSLYQSGELEDAERLFRSVLNDDKNNLVALYQMALYFKQKKDYKTSLAYLDKVIRLSQSSDRFFYEKARLLKNRQEYLASLEDQ